MDQISEQYKKKLIEAGFSEEDARLIANLRHDLGGRIPSTGEKIHNILNYGLSKFKNFFD